MSPWRSIQQICMLWDAKRPTSPGLPKHLSGDILVGCCVGGLLYYGRGVVGGWRCKVKGCRKFGVCVAQAQEGVCCGPVVVGINLRPAGLALVLRFVDGGAGLWRLGLERSSSVNGFGNYDVRDLSVETECTTNHAGKGHRKCTTGICTCVLRFAGLSLMFALQVPHLSLCCSLAFRAGTLPCALQIFSRAKPDSKSSGHAGALQCRSFAPRS